MPAKTIANPTAVLGLSSKGFTSGLAQAGASFKNFASGFASGMTGVIGSVAKFTGVGGIIAGVVGSIGIGALVNQQMEAIDVAGKLSDRLGITAESLTGLQHAANLSGVSNESLAKGMTILQKNMVDAARGGKQTSAAFAALGLDAKELADLPTDQVIGKIGDALNAVENPAERAALQMKIFGKAGAELSPLLKEGSKGLASAVKEADALGISYSRVDAANVEEANDAITRALTSVKGVATQIAIAIAPGITAVADLFTTVGMKVVALAKTFLPPIVAFVGGMVESFLSFVSPLVNWFQTNFAAIAQWVGGTVASTVSFVQGVLGGLASFVWGVVSSLGQVFGLLTDEVGGVGNVFQWLRDVVSGTFLLIGYSVRNWQLVTEIAFLSAALGVVKLGNQIEYVLAEVIPSVLSWFADNWRDIFTTLWNFTSSVFTNMGENVGNFFAAVWSWLKGDGFDFQWTGLLEGFESTIEELPKIAEREVGPLEKALGDELGAAQTKWIDGLANEINAQDQLANNIRDGITDALGSPIGDLPSAPNFGTVGAFTGIEDEEGDKKQRKEKAEASAEGTSILTGSAQSLALRDAIIRPPSGDIGSDPAVEVPKAIRETADENYNQLAALSALLEKYFPEILSVLRGSSGEPATELVV